MENPIYNQIGHHYSKYRKADPRLVDAILKYLDLPEQSSIGDIGAGTGNYSRAIADQGHLIKCIEPSLVMTSQKQQHQNIQWLQGVAENLPLATSTMTSVIAILAFHHFRNSEQAIAEMLRVTKGKLLLFTFDPRTIEPPWFVHYSP